MYPLLNGLRVIEGSSFIASPSAGMYLAQFGAEVIRFDTIGGGPDFTRWPLDPHSRASFYWEGLNKGKKSIALDLCSAEGRNLAVRLITADDPRGGLFLTNFPAGGFLAHEKLTVLRPDLVTLRIMGNADGSSALDYTANAAVGVPFMTGPAGLGDAPVNNLLPTWDLLSGAYAAFALLAAERQRRETGVGGEVRIPLSDVAIATMANLGFVAEALATGVSRSRIGNEVFGAFGRDFATRDGHRIMLLAISPKQWRALLEALRIGPQIAALEHELSLSFATDEGLRFDHRERLFAIVEAAARGRDYADLAADLDRLGACWGPYRTTLEAARDPTLVDDNPLFAAAGHPSGRTYPTPGAMATLPALERHPPAVAPRLGQHTDEVLAQVLGLSEGEIGRLHDRGVVAGPV